MTERVTWWLGRGPSPREFQELFVEPFNAGQDRIHLDVTVLETAARDRTVAALENGTGPDIVMIPRAGDFVAQAARGFLLDLAPYADRFGWHDRLLAPAMRMTRYGLPRSSETMMLMFNPRVLDELGCRPPANAAELESVAGAAMKAGLQPFGAGCADMPESAELLWTLVVNHYAGPAAVRAALGGELPWTAPIFVEALEQLVGWFDRGWFGTSYFTDTIDQGIARVVDGRAAMNPGMTGLVPAGFAPVDAAPFPTLRDGLRGPLYVFGTASLIGVNAVTRVPDEAATIIDRVFTGEVRRAFSTAVPGDWNIPLADPDAEALTGRAPRVFAQPAVGLSKAVSHGLCGYADWSYLQPGAEEVVAAQVRPLAEGTLKAGDHLAELQETFARERASGPAPGL